MGLDSDDNCRASERREITFLTFAWRVSWKLDSGDANLSAD